jgi:hypothetical protein
MARNGYRKLLDSRDAPSSSFGVNGVGSALISGFSGTDTRINGKKCHTICWSFAHPY